MCASKIAFLFFTKLLILSFILRFLPNLNKPEQKHICHKGTEVKNPGPKDQALFYPQRGFALLKVQKSQISNHKYQTISNDRNLKFQTMFRPERFWSLNIGICDFRHKTPRQSHVSLTWPKEPGFSEQNKGLTTRQDAIPQHPVVF